MSGEQNPSHFVEQEDFHNTENFNEIWGIGDFNVENQEFGFDGEQYWDDTDQDAVLGRGASSSEQLQKSVFYARGDDQPQLNPDRLLADQDETPYTRHSVVRRNLPNYGQPTYLQSNEEQQEGPGRNMFAQSRPQFLSPQNTVPPHSSFGNSRGETGLTNNNQAFQVQGTPENWNHLLQFWYPDSSGAADAQEPSSATENAGNVSAFFQSPSKIEHSSSVDTAALESVSTNTPTYIGTSPGLPFTAVSSRSNTAARSIAITPGLLRTSSNPQSKALGCPTPSTKGKERAVFSPAANPLTGESPRPVNDADPQKPGEYQEEGGDDDNESEQEGAPISNRFPTYEENDASIREDPHQKDRGRTGNRNGHEVGFNPQTSKWQPSASHHDMRATLIARAQAEYPNDRYAFPDPTDDLPHAETAFFKPHQHRGPDRENCADELFTRREARPKVDENGRRLPRPKSIYIGKHPGYMYEGDKILLDPHKNPVVNHKFIPLTLSAYTDGGKLQEMALHPGCRQVDLWARMPRFERIRDKAGNYTVRELRGKNTRINMPMTRFREKKGTISGEDRDDTDKIREGLLNFYRYHGFDPVTSGNSTKSFPRDLKAWEVKEVRLGNAARFGKRAGTRALADNVREEKFEKMKQSIANGKRKAAETEEHAENRRQAGAVQGPQDTEARVKQRHRKVRKVDARLSARDQQYSGSYGVAVSKDGQDGHGSLNYHHHSQQQGYSQSPMPTQEQAESYGKYQSPNAQAQPWPSNGQVYPNPEFAHPGSLFTPIQHRELQAPYGGFDDYPKLQESFNQTTAGNQVHAVVTDQPAQALQSENHYEPVQYSRHGMVQNGPISSLGSGNVPIGQVSKNNHGPPAQRKESSTETNALQKLGGNTLGPGGRAGSSAPRKAILGKRRLYNAEDTSPTMPNSLELGQRDIQSNISPDVEPSYKRRRNHATPGTEPFPQRRQVAKPSRQGRYGSQGATRPLLPSGELLASTQPPADISVNAEGRFDPSGAVFRSAEQTYEFGGDVDGPFITQDSESLRETSQMLVPPQVLGKRGRGQPLRHDHRPIYVASLDIQSQVQLEQDGNLEDTTWEPEPKRRLRPTNEGYYSAPAKPSRATVLQAARAARDAHLHQPLFDVNEPVRNPEKEGEQFVAHPKAPAPLQTPLLAPVPTFDIRNEPPVDGDEAQSLERALSYTRAAYWKWTGEEAPVTNLEDCFNVQYYEILVAFQLWWGSDRNPQCLDPVPELYQLPAWTGSIEKWEGPDNMEQVLAPVDRMRWAAPGPDWNVEDFDLGV